MAPSLISNIWALTNTIFRRIITKIVLWTVHTHNTLFSKVIPIILYC
jgi:hypothetical protein